MDPVGPPGRFLRLADGIYHAPRIRLAWLASSQQAFVSYLDGFRAVTERMRARLGVSGIVPSERIVLLRDADKRLVEPAQEALQRLIDHDGFSVARPERLSIGEQARLFAGAASLVAPHGAGLSNILFGDPSLRILELNTEYDGPCVRPWFYLLAAIRRQPYAYLNQTRSRFDAAQIREMALRFVAR